MNEQANQPPNQPISPIKINQPTIPPSSLSGNMDVSTPEEKPRSAVVVTKLDFTYDGMDSPVLKKFDLDLPAGSRYELQQILFHLYSCFFVFLLFHVCLITFISSFLLFCFILFFSCVLFY